MLAIRLPEDIEARLADLAVNTGRTKTFYVKEAILEHLDEIEDKYLAIKRLENPNKRWTLDELEQEKQLPQLKHKINLETQTSLWNDLCGQWKDQKSKETTIKEIYDARTLGREINL